MPRTSGNIIDDNNTNNKKIKVIAIRGSYSKQDWRRYATDLENNQGQVSNNVVLSELVNYMQSSSFFTNHLLQYVQVMQ